MREMLAPMVMLDLLVLLETVLHQVMQEVPHRQVGRDKMVYQETPDPLEMLVELVPLVTHHSLVMSLSYPVALLVPQAMPVEQEMVVRQELQETLE